jgi:hypothetical protein
MKGSTKASPKSCSCTQCRRGKATEGGHHTRTHEERAFRRETKQALKQGREDIPPSPHGTYTD